VVGLGQSGILASFLFRRSDPGVRPHLALVRDGIDLDSPRQYVARDHPFAIGTVSGIIVGMWLALSLFLGRVLDPFIKAANSMPRLIFAPIFALWFGLGIWSKVALGALVFFVVFFNVFQGVREVSPVVLANVRMLGANRPICCDTSICRRR
jgi:hypothetical protein